MKVLVGLGDDTPEGAAALRAAVRQCSPDGTLILVGFVPTPTGEDPGATLKTSTAEVHARCQAQADRIAAESGVNVEIEVPMGTTRPSQAILRAAEARDVDLIVIGLRRRSRVGKLVLGSNAQDILLRAEAPVLSVKVSDGHERETS